MKAKIVTPRLSPERPSVMIFSGFLSLCKPWCDFTSQTVKAKIVTPRMSPERPPATIFSGLFKPCKPCCDFTSQTVKAKIVTPRLLQAFTSQVVNGKIVTPRALAELHITFSYLFKEGSDKLVDVSHVIIGMSSSLLIATLCISCHSHRSHASALMTARYLVHAW